MKYITLPAVGNFMLYMAMSLALLWLFSWLYKRWTPYDEFVQMRAGKKAPAFAMGGAMLGFTFPLLSMSYHGINVVDFVIWSVVACVIQLVLFKILYLVMRLEVEEDNQAVGIFYCFAAVCVGLFNAVSLIPH